MGLRYLLAAVGGKPNQVRRNSIALNSSAVFKILFRVELQFISYPHWFLRPSSLSLLVSNSGENCELFEFYENFSASPIN